MSLKDLIGLFRHTKNQIPCFIIHVNLASSSAVTKLLKGKLLGFDPMYC